VSQMPVVGLPEGMPRAPEVAPATPPVGARQAERAGQPMTTAERARLEAELTAARTGAAARTRARIRQSAEDVKAP